jgi:outer membrane protein
MFAAMTVRRGAWIAICCGWLGACLPGCWITPAEIDESLLTRYQQSILMRSPQQRAGADGLNLLRPVPEKERMSLKMVKDDLTGEDAVELSLERVLRMALASSPEIRVVGFDPAISREDMVAAAAAFDVAVFGGAERTWTDHNTGSTFQTGRSETTAGEAGLRNRNIFGGQVELKWDMTRSWDDSAFTTLNPRYESTLTLALTQPLLRGGGPDYNLAALHLAEVGQKVSYSQFRQKVEEVVAQVEALYWQLVQARGNLRILQETLKQGEETLRKVEARKGIDAREKLEVQQTIVAVESRRAALIRARKSVADVEDALARLVSDPRLNLMTDYRIRPVDAEPKVARFTVDPMDQLLTALKHSPLLEQARLGIEAAEISVRVAWNETLPALNLTGSTSAQGLRGNFMNAVDDRNTFDYIDYSIGVLFEYPLGNRAAQAKLRQQRFGQRQAVATLQNIADQVAVAVNETVRQIQANFEDIEAQEKVVRAVQANVEGLQAQLELGRQGYLFLLDQLLRQQDALGSARRAKLQAQVNFKNAIVRLAHLTGTALQMHHVKLMAEEVSRD